MHKISLTLFLLFLTNLMCYSQNINLENYDIYLGDTLIAKQDFIKNSQSLNKEQAGKIQFKPITDGIKKAYFLNGKLYSQGKIENLKENGIWEYWYENGQIARKGEFINGKPNGTHEYWYENGTLRSIGNWSNGTYEGKWEMYSEDGKKKIIQNYKNGKEVL
ncbi:toxin-antitoxin system YwqK family antitoxin [Chryseobacterium sp. M5A1_1a]